MFTHLRFFSLIICLFIFNSLFSLSEATPQEGRTYRLAITQIVEHPSLDAIRKGIIDELAAHGYTARNLEITFDNAQGNIAVAAQIAQRFVHLFPDVIVAISTPSAQTVVNAVKDTRIPVVFGAVTDPVAAKLVSSLDQPDPKITGTIDLPPTEDQLNFIQEILPDIKTLGVLYNPGETNTVLQVSEIHKVAKALGLRVIEATPTKTSEVSSAATSLAAKVDALLIPNDNTVVSALESVLRSASYKNIPVFTSDPDSVKKGALAALANDQYRVGRATGKIVSHILSGQPPPTVPIRAVQIAKRYVNQKTADKLGLTVLADVAF